MDSSPLVLGAAREIPPHVIQRLQSLSFSPSQILFAIKGDLDEFGHIKPVWLVATLGKVVAFEEEDTQKPSVGPFLLEDVNEFRVRSTIGSASFQAVRDGLPVDMIRFTNQYREIFSRAVHQLRLLKEGQAWQPERMTAPEPLICAKCGLVLPAVMAPCPRCLKQGAVLSRTLKLLGRYTGWVFILLALMLFGIGLDLLPPYLTKILVDDVLLADTHEDWLLWLVLGLAGASMFRGVVNIFVSRLATYIGTRITYDVRQQVFEKLQQMSIAYYDRMEVGRLMTRCMSDVEQLHGFVSQAAQGFLINILMIIAIGGTLFSLDPHLATYVLIPIPFVIGGSVYFYRKIYPKYYKLSDSHSKLTSILNSTLSGIRLVKAFAQEDRELDRFKGGNVYFRDSRRIVDMASGTFSPIMAFIFGLGGLIIWYVGGKDVLGDRITLGTLTAFLSYVGMFYGPLSSLTQFSNWLTSFMTSSNRVFEVLDTDPGLHDNPNARPMPKVEGGIEFDQVVFGYDPYTPIIKEVSLKIEPGQMVGIVGRSGSGKTTLINLLCRFYDVQEGTVRIDGQDVRDIRRHDLHRHIGLVLQEPALFRATIADNISYGNPKSSIQDIMTAAKAANAHDFIMSRPAGYDTMLGERGAGLSGGERQRISIARALLCNPSILILDEATSSVDTESEQQIQEALAVLCKGRTTIAIAHRLSTLRGADCIFVIENGRLIESGSHSQLMGQKGVYHRLVQIQTQLTALELEHT
ncbi:MAG: ABC transporter ATP-binding protein [candidate division Zixibacteria bacterium]|nr:ABC transporter ATP-binding protein [candidate division Zixibacteria bacterium]